MPHRPADSRLLSNLLSQEKDYVRCLYSQLDYGQASLASYSAYAAASPPPASRAIASVAAALAGAHDALRSYVSAVEEWCEQLKMLKNMEDEVGTIARDREILVDRLIKASKTNNPKRRSLLHSSPSSNQGSSVFSSSNHTLDQLTFSNSKLNLAQSELQACETHLTEKERMLAQMRETCLLGGMKMRCKALAECGLKWSEVGETGLHALDASYPRDSPDRSIALQKPLPNINYPYHRPSSDVSSSLAPSQSASQIFHPDATSDQCYPSRSSPSGTRGRTNTNGPSPDVDIKDESRVELTLPPAHAISEEDHYTPPQARITKGTQDNDEDDIGGSSVEEGTDERQCEVHENQLFVHHSPSPKSKPKQPGSKMRLSMKRQPKRLNSDNTITATIPASASSPLPSAHNGRLGPVSTEDGRAYSLDGYQDATQEHSQQHSKKRFTFPGLGALSGIFHRRDRSSSAPTHGSAEPSDPEYASSSPNKREKWRTRTDKNIKKATGKNNDESSDDEAVEQPGSGQDSRAHSTAVPSYLLSQSEPSSQSASRPIPTPKETNQSRPKRTSIGGKKLRKNSDATHRRSSDGGDSAVPQTNEKMNAKPSAVKGSETPRAQSIGNGQSVSPLSSASVSRSSTVRSQSTIKTSSSTNPASPDPASPSGKSNRAATLTKGVGTVGSGRHHRRASLGNVSSPPTTRSGQMSLLAIVEDVTKQNRQGWLQFNPNSLLVEAKAPQSIFHTLNLDGPSASASMSSTPERTHSDVAGRRTESPLRHQLYGASDLRRNSFAASNSEPSLPLKKLPPTPNHTPKAPLRSALRNRSASPNTTASTATSPRSGSPAPQILGKSVVGSVTVNGNGINTPRPVSERNGSAGSSSKNDNDDDAASTGSAYETGHEDFDSGPPTPNGNGKSTGPSQQHAVPNVPNGHVFEMNALDGSHASGDSTEGTATPPSRRKSVRVSLKPTYSPTPPALADYEEDRSPWAPNPPVKDKNAQGHSLSNGGGWVSRRSAESIWDDSSDDEDEEYSRAREMLSRASHKLEKAYKSKRV